MADDAGRYASRKFILAGLVLIEAAGFLAADVIEPSVWASITGAVIAAYLTANVAQKATQGGN